MDIYQQVEYSGTFPNHSQEAHISTHQSQQPFYPKSNCLHFPTEQSFLHNNMSLNELTDYQYDYRMNLGQQSLMSNSDDMYLRDQLVLDWKSQSGLNQGDKQLVLLSISEIKVEILPKEKLLQSFKITNASSQNVEIYIDSIFSLKNSLSKFKLNPWSSQEITIELLANNGEQFGDIFETITIQYSVGNNQPKKIFLPITIHIITPRLKLLFEGSSQIVNIPKNNQKVARIRIQPNYISQYPLQLSLNSNTNLIKKYHFNIKTYGCISVFPQDVRVIGNESTRVMIKRDGAGTKGVMEIRNDGVLFVLGVLFD